MHDHTRAAMSRSGLQRRDQMLDDLLRAMRQHRRVQRRRRTCAAALLTIAGTVTCLAATSTGRDTSTSAHGSHLETRCVVERVAVVSPERSHAVHWLTASEVQERTCVDWYGQFSVHEILTAADRSLDESPDVTPR